MRNPVKSVKAWLVAMMVLFWAAEGFALSSVSGVYQIGSCQDLVEFANLVNTRSGLSRPYVGANAVVTAPINMSCTDNFVGIGEVGVNGSGGYAGTFDGQGYPISNLKMSGDGQNYGLFKVVNGGTIKNVVLVNVDISATRSGVNDDVSVGAIVGWMKSGSSVQNCYASGNITTSGDKQKVGGLVGNNQEQRNSSSGGTITNSLSTVTVSCSGNNAEVGGIAGNNSGSINSCVYDGEKGSLINNGSGGHTGGIAGDGNSPTNSYYSKDAAVPAVGSGGGSTGGVAEVNTEENACKLNGGTWSNDSCQNEQQSVWDNGGNITNTGVSKDNSNNTLFSVYFDANGGQFSDGSTSQKKQLQEGATITTNGIPQPAREHYTFAGWSLTGIAPAVVDFGTVKKTETYKAIWEKQIEVIFCADELTPCSSEKIAGTSYFDKGAHITSNGVTAPADYDNVEGTAHYTFLGWASSASASAPGDLGNADENKTVYAVWSTENFTFHTVSFEMDGHGYVASQRVKDGETASAVAEPSAEGYTFGGWYANSELTNAFNFGSAISGATTVYAKWTPVAYTITYNLDGGSNSNHNPSTYTIESQDIVLVDPARNGYVFKGWFTDEGKTKEIDVILNGSTGNMTLYASWEIAKYKITYLAGGGGVTGLVPAGEKTHGVDFTLSLATFTRSEYTQDGWSLQPGGEKKFEMGGEYSENADLTLYPYWGEANKVAVKYDTTSVAGVTANYKTFNIESGFPHYLIDHPEKDGYSFVGWKKGGDLVTVDKITVSEAVTFTGQFSLIAYGIYPGCKDYLLCSHLSSDISHKKMLEVLEMLPIVDAGMRLGEGTGADLAVPILQMAIDLCNKLGGGK